MTTTIDHAVSVVKAETIVGHVPQEMSRTSCQIRGVADK